MLVPYHETVKLGVALHGLGLPATRLLPVAVVSGDDVAVAIAYGAVGLAYIEEIR